MKKLLAFVLALSLLCMGGVALADGETLVIYSARNERLNNIVIPAFEAKTGIKVEMITGSSGEVLQRVKSEVETGNVTVDIHWAADETMLAANRDLFEVYVSTENDALVPLFLYIVPLLLVGAALMSLLAEHPLATNVNHTGQAGKGA